jgi:hypothetical protein
MRHLGRVVTRHLGARGMLTGSASTGGVISGDIDSLGEETLGSGDGRRAREAEHADQLHMKQRGGDQPRLGARQVHQAKWAG